MGESLALRIRMIDTVRPDFIFLARPGTVLLAGEEYEAVSNQNGAISGICENGERLGVRPGEFEFVKAPAWLVQMWGNFYPTSIRNVIVDG